MELVTNYLEDAEKKLRQEISVLFSKMREQWDTMSLEGIEDMYSIKPVEGVLYDPCVRIPLSLSNLGTRYNSAYVRLPKDEFVIDIFRHHYSINNQPLYTDCYYCFALTNYGRFINTIPVTTSRGPFDSSFSDHSPTTLTIIENLEILPYKMPSWYYNLFKKLHGNLSLFLGGGGYTTTNTHNSCPSQTNLNEIALDATNSLQELNKEFYLFAGKWQPHMTEHATLDINKMRQTIIENTDSIKDLSEKNRELEEQNKKLQAELQELKGQKASLEKEKVKLLPLEKYKDAVLEFMREHYDGDELYDSSDSEHLTIGWFNDWHATKVFMDKWDYNDVMESKEELNEYRIYKKVKGEMVSNGMDNSSVARNVRKIKKGVNKLNS